MDDVMAAWHELLRHHVDWALTTQRPALEAAALRLADTLSLGRSFFAFGCNHSRLLVDEIFYRAGSLVPVNPIDVPGLRLDTPSPLTGSDLEKLPGLARRVLDHTPLGAGDLLLVVSTSGRNTVPVEMAAEGKARGAGIVALTSLPYAESQPSLAPSGKRLHELADVVLDHGAPPGDAALTVPGVGPAMGPVSTIVGAALLHAWMARTAQLLAERGSDPPVFQSANRPGGGDWNRAVLARWEAQIHWPHH
jgi:uncharacterized phosphosugar-binding protein